MKRLLWLSLLFAAGCSRAPQLTPLEEYKLAADLVDREYSLLREYEQMADPKSQKDVKWIEVQQKQLDRAREIMKRADAKLNKSL